MSLATRIAQEFNNVRSHISGITAYHLLQGNLSVSNEVITNGFSTTLYTGNGGTQSINTGIDMATQWGDDASEMFGGLSWIKSRSAATNNYFVDTVRGATKDIYSNATTAEITEATGLTSFTSTGFNLGTLAGMNTNLATYVSWNFQTTHRTTGVTNHGKAFTEHYNPFTGFTIIKYEGSGLAGHEIPHSLGRKLGFSTVKFLTGDNDWATQYRDNNFLYLNTIAAEVSNSTVMSFNANSTVLNVPTGNGTGSWIMYGWANSYYDEADKLIGNYEIGVYQGTGIAGNKVTTRGKPAWIMVKKIDSIGNWVQADLLRNNFDEHIVPNTNAVAASAELHTVYNDGFTLNQTDPAWNGSGGQYLYMVVYDNDNGSGKSKYPKATDTSNVQINDSLIPLAHGIDSNGSKNSIVVANETITGLTYTVGKNYLYKTDTGYGVKPYKPRYLSSELVRRFAGEQPDYYDVQSNKWFNTDAGTDLVSNGKLSSGVTTGWVGINATLSISNNVLVVTPTNTTGQSLAETILNTVIGKKYTIMYSFILGTAVGGTIYVENSSGGNTTQPLISLSVPSTGAVEFVAQSTTTYLKLRCNTTSAQTTLWDNISVFEADIDPTTEITESRNYLNHIVNADQNGQVTYVEELPKIEYKDVIKANEYRGKNACTAWVNFDGSTTPPTIRDSYNVSSVIRLANGDYNVYFKVSMDNMNYVSTVDFLRQNTWVNSGAHCLNHSIDKFRVNTIENNTGLNSPLVKIQIFGGKN